MKKWILTIGLIQGIGTLNPALSWSQELKDVKPPVEYPFSWGWIVALIVLVILFLLIGLGIFFWKQRKRTRPQEPQVILLPWEKAFQLLDALAQENLIDQGKVKEYFLRLSTILRHYFEEELGLNAPDRTTEEFLVLLKSSPQMNNQQKNALKEFLTCCDMVKFAKHEPGMETSQQSMEIVKRLINETKKSQRSEEGKGQ